jgi:hypothetical protein
MVCSVMGVRLTGTRNMAVLVTQSKVKEAVACEAAARQP